MYRDFNDSDDAFFFLFILHLLPLTKSKQKSWSNFDKNHVYFFMGPIFQGTAAVLMCQIFIKFQA